MKEPVRSCSWFKGQFPVVCHTHTHTVSHTHSNTEAVKEGWNEFKIDAKWVNNQFYSTGPN